MRHPKGTRCQLKTPGSWPLADHELVIKAYNEGEAVIYEGPQLEEGEKRARHIRELLNKLPDYPAHPTAQALLGGRRKGFRARTTQTGLQEWRVVLKTGPFVRDWLLDFIF